MTRPEPIRLQRKNKENMARRKPIVVLIGLGLAMAMGLAIYLRLWTIDYRISSDETELIRKQFDLANREAMDESAYWRSRYDEEVNKVSNCQKELLEIKQSTRVEDAGSNSKLESLQKEKMDLVKKIESLEHELRLVKSKHQENMGLLKKIESLKQELGSEKLKCSRKEP